MKHGIGLMPYAIFWNPSSLEGRRTSSSSTPRGSVCSGNWWIWRKTGLTLAQAEKKLREELASGAVKHDQSEDQTPGEGIAERLIRHLEEQIQIKDRQLEEKDRQIERLQELLQNRLPGQRVPAMEDPLEYLRLTIEKQREEIERLRQLLEERTSPPLPLWRRLLRPRSSKRPTLLPVLLGSDPMDAEVFALPEEADGRF